MINKEKKTQLISDYKLSDNDTGSVEVQVALLTNRINDLNGHFKANPKDYASKTGLMKMVGRRRRFLTYIQDRDEAFYKTLIGRLGIRG